MTIYKAFVRPKMEYSSPVLLQPQHPGNREILYSDRPLGSLAESK